MTKDSGDVFERIVRETLDNPKGMRFCAPIEHAQYLIRLGFVYSLLGVTLWLGYVLMDRPFDITYRVVSYGLNVPMFYYLARGMFLPIRCKGCRTNVRKQRGVVVTTHRSTNPLCPLCNKRATEVLMTRAKERFGAR